AVLHRRVGEADVAWQKGKFESGGVSTRVGYAGRRKDMPSFLRIADVYVAEFPACASIGLLQAMAMERPVVALAGSDAANLAGEEAISGAYDASTFVERISKLTRDPAQRAKLGKSMR